MKKILAIAIVALSLGAFAPVADGATDLISATNLSTSALGSSTETNLLAGRTVPLIKVIPGEGLTIWAKLTGTNAANTGIHSTNRVTFRANASVDGTTNRLSTTNPFWLDAWPNTNRTTVWYTNIPATSLEGLSGIVLTSATNHNHQSTNGIIINEIWVTRDKP